MSNWLFDLSVRQAMLSTVVLFVGATWLGVLLVRELSAKMKDY
jgi:hypothetical protein